jgi:hypothetical protein
MNLRSEENLVKNQGSLIRETDFCMKPINDFPLKNCIHEFDENRRFFGLKLNLIAKCKI